MNYLNLISRDIPDFNRRSLSLGDLEVYCSWRGIVVIYRPMADLHGIALQVDGVRVLRINNCISPAEQIIAGFHELKHFLLDPFDPPAINNPRVYCSTGERIHFCKREYQAQAVGVIALMPDEAASGKTVGDLARQFAVSRELASFRKSLFDEANNKSPAVRESLSSGLTWPATWTPA